MCDDLLVRVFGEALWLSRTAEVRLFFLVSKAMAACGMVGFYWCDGDDDDKSIR